MPIQWFSEAMKKGMFYFSREKNKTWAVAFLPREPQELVKTSPEKVPEAGTDSRPSFLGTSHLPSCSRGTHIHQETLQPQWPHLPVRTPHHVSTHRAGQAWAPRRECRAGCAVPKITGIREKQHTGTFKSVDALLRHWPSILTQTPWKNTEEIEI